MADRKIERRNGYVVVTPEDMGTCVPMVCPVCSLAMGTREDLATFNSWSCCAWCKDMFARGTLAEAKWRDGKRPPVEQVQAILKSLGMI